ncbi:MAG TPA: serine/threonine-protein kinase, partial [Saprospiraceae bacterium]|nr:serine/threonine-protein kinase [Saprospiraceae bacterium]
MKTGQDIGKVDLITGYEILNKIQESYPHAIYLATRKEDNTEVVLKTLIDQYPRKEDIAGIRREYKIIHDLQADGVIHVHALIPHGQGNLAMVLEYFGISLKQYLASLEKQILPLDQFFTIAIRLVKAISNVHDKRIVHKSIDPSNILIDPATLDLRLIDFGSSSELSREHLDNINLTKKIEGSLAYISPEQTGRINRDIDYRTDYYSLGVTFYQMLTGKLPYSANDPLEWVHCAISRQPPQANAVNNKIPAVLAELVAKLMAKNAEERYQSSHGLIADLEKCRDQYSRGGDFTFQLAQTDVSRRFHIPQKLFGRENEIEKLESYFENAAEGAVEFCLVSGYSGIG